MTEKMPELDGLEAALDKEIGLESYETGGGAASDDVRTSPETDIDLGPLDEIDQAARDHEAAILSCEQRKVMARRETESLVRGLADEGRRLKAKYDDDMARISRMRADAFAANADIATMMDRIANGHRAALKAMNA